MSFVLIVAFLIFLICFLKFARPKLVDLLDDSIEKIRQQVVDSQRKLSQSNASVNDAVEFRAKLDDQKAAIIRKQNEIISELLASKEIEKQKKIEDVKRTHEENRSKEIEGLNEICKMHFSRAIINSVTRIARLEKIDQKTMLSVYIDLAKSYFESN